MKKKAETPGKELSRGSRARETVSRGYEGKRRSLGLNLSGARNRAYNSENTF